MALVQNFPFAVIVVYLASGVLCSVMSARVAKWYCLALNAAATVLMGATLAYTVRTGEAYVYWMGHCPAPWGNELRVGPLETLMAAAFCGVMLLSLMGGMSHILEDCEPKKVNLYFSASCLLMSSLTSLVFTNDLFTAYVFVEINTITACALIMLNYRSGQALVATTQYLIMSLLGSGLFLLGVMLLYDLTGHLLMEDIGAAVRNLAAYGGYVFPLTVIIGLFSIGMSLKSALFPFHMWLPDAHSSATSASSAILSGLVLKAYIFILLKIYCRVIGLDLITVNRIPDVLFLFGAAAMVFGSVQALWEKDLKRMLAYSSVAQIGYVFVGIGLGTLEGLLAACLQILAHAFTKPMLFCAAGGFMGVSGGSRRLEDLRGAGRRDPASGAAFLVGTMSMIGVPLFGGFAVKAQLSLAAIERTGWKAWFALGAIVISTVLNALYYLHAVQKLFSKEGAPGVVQEKARYSGMYLTAMGAMIALNVYFGIHWEGFTHVIERGLALFA